MTSQTHIPRTPWYSRIGPAFITAAVVLGPGSIIASSRAGAESGYGLVWLLLAACFLMMAFTYMGARLGCALSVTPLQYVAERWGRPFALIVGVSAFLVASGFQFGNNIGVSVAAAELTSTNGYWWPPIFTLLSLTFLFAAKNLYRLLERAMLLLVSLMLLAFAGNLAFTGFSPVDLASGAIPRGLHGDESLIARALFATTFSVVAAFYQAYLVQSKGWRTEDLRFAVRDTWLGIGVLSGIALVIMISAAEALRGNGADFNNIGQLASQLEGSLGTAGATVFNLGLAAASFSSFIANAIIGGTLLSDGLGYGKSPDSPWVRWCTAAVMIIGCVVAMGILLFGRGGTQSLLVAQSSTLVAAPICAVLLFGLSRSRRAMGSLRIGVAGMIAGVSGIAIVLWLSFGTLRNLLPI